MKKPFDPETVKPGDTGCFTYTTVTNALVERPPMSRERFRQEAVLAYTKTGRYLDVILDSADKLTDAVFDGG